MMTIRILRNIIRSFCLGMGEVKLTMAFTGSYFGIANLYAAFQSDKHFGETSSDLINLLKDKS